MAWQDIDNHGWKNGAVTVKASSSVTADADTAGVVVGKGIINLVFDITVNASITAEAIDVQVQFNTIAAPTVWQTGAYIRIGNTADSDILSAVGKYQIIVENKSDHQVRLSQTVVSTPATTYSVVAVPLRTKVVS